MKSNSEQLKIAEKYLGESCPKCCHMGNNCCCYFVSKIFAEAGNSMLFYSGRTVTYCPNAIKWCKTNLAQIPLYIAMPSDIIFFDWELNGTPNHIGFVDHRIDDQEIATLEGNTTSRGVVARRVRTEKYIQGIFRPHFRGEFSKDKALVIDGQFGYNSIAMLQKALGQKQDAILGIKTIKALQKKVGVKQDGSWGKDTSKALQRMLKKNGFYKGKIDGLVYEATVKALQKWINKQNGKADVKPQKTEAKKPSKKKPTKKPTKTEVKKTKAEIRIEKGLKWLNEQRKRDFHYVNWDGSKAAKECPLCHNHKEGGKYWGWNCIGLVSAYLHHGMELKYIKCANNGFLGGNDNYTRLLSSNSSYKEAQAFVDEKLGKGRFKLLRKGGRTFPVSRLKPGDIVVYYKHGEFWHIAVYVGDGKIIDSSSSTNGVTKRGYKLAYPIKAGFRYIGE